MCLKEIQGHVWGTTTCKLKQTGSFSVCITIRLTCLSSMTLLMGEKKKDNIYLQQTSEPGWLTLMSAASQEVFQHSCLGAVGQTDRGFPTNTHRTFAGPDWNSDRLSFPPAAISRIAQNTLLLYVQGLEPQRRNIKASLISHHLLFSSLFSLQLLWSLLEIKTLLFKLVSSNRQINGLENKHLRGIINIQNELLNCLK